MTTATQPDINALTETSLRDIDPNWTRPALTSEQFDNLQKDLDQIRDEVRADIGEKDARHIKTMVKIQRGLDILGRIMIHFSFTPIPYLLGVGMLGLSKILDNMEIGHNVIHGQYDWMNDPKLNSRTFEWDNTCDANSWRRTHNFEHHTYTNILGKDRDFGYALFRLSDDVQWRPPHRVQVAEMAVLSLGFQVFVGFHELEMEKFRTGEVTWEGKKPFMSAAKKKIAKVFFKDYVLFPLLAGPFFLKVFLGNMMANIIRNIWASSVIYLGHFPGQAQTFTEEEAENESKGQWYYRQMLGSANITGGRLMHIMTGHLSCQIEHHLFPDLPANRYEEIAPKVEAVCKKYGLPYNTGSFTKQYFSFIKRLIKYSSRPSDPNKIDPRYR